jgi:selenocysteine lyase/cysteine desulfurase
MSPLLKSVEKAGLRGVRAKRNPVAISPESFFTSAELLRREFAELIHVADTNRIAIIPSVSYGIANVTKNVKITKGEHILLADNQFPSNYYPWQELAGQTGAELRVVSPEKGMTNRGMNWNLKFLESITKDTRAVAIAHTHWADGTRFNLEAIRTRTREVGALLIVDGTQSVGALTFDVRKIQPDALICAGYKWLLGPYSLGVAYYGEYFNGGKPVEENWINRLDSDDFSALVNYQSQYQPGARRYSVGEQSNFILVPMLRKAIAQLNRWRVDNVQEYCQAITEPVIDRLREKGFQIEDQAYRGAHLFGIRHPKFPDTEIFKNQLLKNKVHVSFRGDAIRVSPHVYNDAADVNKLGTVLLSAVS